MGTRTVAAVALVVGGVLAGCGDDPASESLVASADTRAALDVVVEALDWPAARDPLTPTMGDETDLAAWGSPISEEDRKRLSEIALAFDGVPAGAEAVRFQPAFGDEGSLSGAVVVLRHASYSGFLELPGLDLMEADGREIAVPQVVRYTVDSAVRMHVAVDLGSGEVLWVTPNRSVTATELVSRSDTDIDGDPVPSDARQLEGE